MTEQDRAAFFDLFAALGRAFDKKPSPAVSDEYFEAMADYPLALVEQAKLDLIRSGKFFPKVADWRRACDTVRAARPTPRLVTSQQLEDGTIARVYCCGRCQDTGWAPACGCAFGQMDDHGMCPRHPRVLNGGMVYRQAMQACACREANPAYQASRPRVTGAAREAGTRGEA